MEKAQLNLALQPSQLDILTRVLDGQRLRRREVGYLGMPVYFGDPPAPMEIVGSEDVEALLQGEGPGLELIEFHRQPVGQALVARLTELGAIYALRHRKGLL